MSDGGTRERQFYYLLNAMENAASQDRPADHGYGEKRCKVLEYVAELERGEAELREALSRSIEKGHKIRSCLCVDCAVVRAVLGKKYGATR